MDGSDVENAAVRRQRRIILMLKMQQLEDREGPRFHTASVLHSTHTDCKGLIKHQGLGRRKHQETIVRAPLD